MAEACVARAKQNWEMPKLLRSSETMGCGATIELDSAEVVYVSIARVGVLVRFWEMKGGFIKTQINNWFGPKLYNESNVYKNAQTAHALRMMFPEQAAPLQFKNSVLAAFSNAIWHCSSAAEVCVVLNEAVTKAPQFDDTAEVAALQKATDPTRELPPKRPPEVTPPTHRFGDATTDAKIISDYAAFMEAGTTKPGYFYDESVLPHSKEAIIAAIEREIVREPHQLRVEWLQTGAVFLSSYQQGVGAVPIPLTGIDLSQLPREPGALIDQFKRLSAKPDFQRDLERANHFKAVANRDDKQNLERVATAIRLRNAKFVDSIRKSADNGNAIAQLKLGNMYVQGQGVPKDYAEAARWYRKAATQGHVKAASQLGLLHLVGQGVPQDYAEAVIWCRKAAEQGDANAQGQLGDMYLKGQGVPKDDAKAAMWCQKAAEQGNATAQLLLGALYHNGQGVPRDYVRAHMWSSLAASQLSASNTESDNKAVPIRDLIAAKMTHSQIADAQKLAREWKPSTQSPAENLPLADIFERAE